MQPVREIKEMIALAMLVVSAYTDIRERNIYLAPLAACTLGAVAVSITAYAATSDAGMMINDLIFPALTGVIIIMLSKCAKAHVGAGDGYLVASLGLLIGLVPDIIAVCAGSAAAAVYAVSAKTLGKKRIRNLPFAPFVLAGFFFVLIREI